MNWFDIALITLLLVAMALGSKKGLIRELMGFFALALGVIITVKNIDFIALEVARHIDASPLIIAVISFVILLVVLYGLFRIAAYTFYKVGELQSLGRKDKVGGAVVGALKGWITIGLVLFLFMLLPMPGAYYNAIDQSVLTQPMMRSLPLLFESTSPLHPGSGSFIQEIEGSINQTEQILSVSHKNNYKDPAKKYAQREKIDLALTNLDKYLGQGLGTTN